MESKHQVIAVICMGSMVEWKISLPVHAEDPIQDLLHQHNSTCPLSRNSLIRSADVNSRRNDSVEDILTNVSLLMPTSVHPAQTPVVSTPDQSPRKPDIPHLQERPSSSISPVLIAPKPSRNSPLRFLIIVHRPLHHHLLHPLPHCHKMQIYAMITFHVIAATTGSPRLHVISLGAIGYRSNLIMTHLDIQAITLRVIIMSLFLVLVGLRLLTMTM